MYKSLQILIFFPKFLSSKNTNQIFKTRDIYKIYIYIASIIHEFFEINHEIPKYKYQSFKFNQISENTENFRNAIQQQ